MDLPRFREHQGIGRSQQPMVQEQLQVAEEARRCAVQLCGTRRVRQYIEMTRWYIVFAGFRAVEGSGASSVAAFSARQQGQASPRGSH